MLENIGASFVFVGIALIFLGMILLMIGKNRTKVEAGGVVFVGPFPIFFGATSTTIALIVVLVSLIFIVLSVFLGWFK